VTTNNNVGSYVLIPVKGTRSFFTCQMVAYVAELKSLGVIPQTATGTVGRKSIVIHGVTLAQAQETARRVEAKARLRVVLKADGKGAPVKEVTPAVEVNTEDNPWDDIWDAVCTESWQEPLDACMVEWLQDSAVDGS